MTWSRPALPTRRDLLGLGVTAAAAAALGGSPSSVLLATPWPNRFPLAPSGQEPVLRAEVLIVGGGIGGVAAALAACRRGRRVILVEETEWLGGQWTSQAVPPDEHRWIESFGRTASYARLRKAVRDHYRRVYPLTGASVRDERLNPGQGRVSRLCCEPRVILAELEAALGPYLAAGRLTILRSTRAETVETEGDRVRMVRLRSRDNTLRVVEAPYILDATELGDLLPLAGAEFVTGAESHADTQEPHAPEQARPDDVQGFTLCFAVEHRPGENHVGDPDPPEDYAFWRDHHPQLEPAWPGPLLSWTFSHPVTLEPTTAGFDPTRDDVPGASLNLWVYRRILAASSFEASAGIRDVSLVNWPQNDFWLAPLHPPQGPTNPLAFHQARARAASLSLSLLHWMRTEAPRPDGGTGWPGLVLRRDITGTADGLAMFPYVRESRRIVAEFTVTENHVGLEARRAILRSQPGFDPTRDRITAAPFADSVGVGAYRIDLHPTTGGRNYLDLACLPFQIPLGALIPVRLENLLPACKNLGVTHLTNGAFRLHPVEWTVGEAAGLLVDFCLSQNLTPRGVRNHPHRLAAFQSLLSAEGLELSWPETSAL